MVHHAESSRQALPLPHPISSTVSNTSSALRQAPSLLSLLTILVRPVVEHQQQAGWVSELGSYAPHLIVPE